MLTGEVSIPPVARDESELRFRGLVERALVGIFRTLPDGRVLEANRSLLRALGFNSIEQINEVGLASLYFDAADRQRLLDTVQVGTVKAFETRFRRADGEVIHAHISAQLVRTPDGSPLYLEGTFEDISAQKRAELNYQRRLASIIDSLPDATFVIDREGHIQAWNRAMESMTGYAAQDMIGKGDHEYAVPFYGERRAILIDLVFQPWQEMKERYAHITERNGTLVGESYTPNLRQGGAYLFATAGPVYDLDGHVVGAIESIRDITDRKQAEVELLQAKEAADVANRAKSAFLANMSHELRTPLNAIIGYSEMLIEESEDTGDESHLEDYQRIVSAGKHLLALINDVLDLSKIEANRLELFFEDVDVARMVSDVATTVRPIIEKKSNALEMHCPSDVGIVSADLTRLRQCLFNLLSNAAKFTERGVISLRVLRETDNGASTLCFEVSDTGVGMTPEQLGRVFQPFVQADSSTTRKYGGTGLGLTITRHFSRLMGGDITVESEYGRGSKFRLRIPTSQKKAAPSVEAAEHSDTRQTQNCPATVLVIDDDEGTRELMSRWLRKDGLQVLTAASGEEGLELARKRHPDVITLDVLMPRQDGWSVLSALKSDPETSDIPVVMLTINTEGDEIGFSLGAAEFLTKPIDHCRLTEVLGRYRRDRQGTVLVVEDDPNTQAMLRRVLERDGWAVSQASNGRLALECLSAAAPALIVLDLMMPEMDGFEFVEEIRRHEQWCTIPIMVMTAKDLNESDRTRLRGRVQRVMQKGAVGPADLLREVRAKVAARCGATASEQN